MNKKVEKTSSIIESLASQYFLTAKPNKYQNTIITVTGVDIAKKVNNVVVWISILSTNTQNKTNTITQKELEVLQKEMRYFISQKADFRYTPQIRLKLDTTGELTQNVYKLIRTQ